MADISRLGLGTMGMKLATILAATDANIGSFVRQVKFQRFLN